MLLVKKYPLIRASINYLKSQKEYFHYFKKIYFKNTRYFSEKIIEIFNLNINREYLNLFNYYLATDNNLFLEDFTNRFSSCFIKLNKEEVKMYSHFGRFLWYALNRYYFLRIGNKKFSKNNPYARENLFEVDFKKRKEYTLFLDLFQKTENYNNKLRCLFKEMNFLLAVD